MSFNKYQNKSYFFLIIQYDTYKEFCNLQKHENKTNQI